MQKKNYFFSRVNYSCIVFKHRFVNTLEKSFFKKIQSYQIIGEFESINGLLENAVVKYRGYPVGRVTKIFQIQKISKFIFLLIQDFKSLWVPRLKLFLMALLVKSTWKSFPIKMKITCWLMEIGLQGFRHPVYLTLLMSEHKTLKNCS